MNEPIISPWIFYWLEIIENFDKVNGFFSLTLGIFNIGLLLYYILSRLENNSRYYRNENIKQCRKIKIVLRKTLPLFMVMLIGVIFIPSKETMYKMLIANYVTQNNVNVAKQNMYDVVEQISNIVIKKIDKEKYKK